MIGAGQIFIYSCSPQLISFETDCFYSLLRRIHDLSAPLEATTEPDAGNGTYFLNGTSVLNEISTKCICYTGTINPKLD